MHKFRNNRFDSIAKPTMKTKVGFTIVELLVVISVIGILATISIVGYGNWQKSIIETQLKSDLSNVATAMNSYRNFNNTYPLVVPTTFKSSQGVVLTGGSSNGTTYCIEASSLQNTTLHYHITQKSGSSGAEEGICVAPVIDTPTSPVVAISTNGGSTSWSWATVLCTAGTTLRYHYQYTISPSGYDSGLIVTTNNNVAFTTSTAGQTYTLQVQAQCYDTEVASNWSVAASKYYTNYGNAVAADILSGKTATTDSGLVTGTMPNKVGSATTLVPNTVNQAIPAGYYGGVVGDGKVTGDANLIPANIVSGKSIFGVAGSAITGKRWASGTITYVSGNISVRSLSFSPTIVIAYQKAYSVNQSIYFSSSYGAGSASDNAWYFVNGSGYYHGSAGTVIYSNGFDTTVVSQAWAGSQDISWIAIE